VPAQLTARTFYSGRIISRCFQANGGTATLGWQNVTSDDPNCAMRVNFASGGTNYTMVMSPLYAGTGRALVHCNAVNNTGSCIDWTVTPNANVANAGVANLFSIAPHNGNEQFIAACMLTYRMHITNP